MASRPQRLRARSRLGKYRILAHIAEGGFADVYSAMDTVEGVKVALKIPPGHPTASELESFRKEVRLTAKLEHPNILSIKNADVIDGRLVVAYPLGDQSLADRLTRRIGHVRKLSYGEQLLEALAYAHQRRIVHCDVKPDNIILFGPERIRLGDFGLARISFKTVVASGSGTLGFMAPEQAMGRPSVRSDVFSAGLVLYRLFGGKVPEWPFRWPLPGHEKLERNLTPGMVRLIRKALQVDARRRFADAGEMLTRYKRILPAARARAR